MRKLLEKSIIKNYNEIILVCQDKRNPCINELLKDLPNAEKLSSLTKSFYKEAADKGKGDLLMSELIKDH